jgi:chromosome segregation ATPase
MSISRATFLTAIVAASFATAAVRADELAATVAKINQQAEQVKTALELQSKANEELTGLRASELKLRTRALSAEQTINDLTSQNDVLNQNYRALQEELAMIKRDVTNVAAGAVASSNNRPFEYTGPVISGRIESVERDVASGNARHAAVNRVDKAGRLPGKTPPLARTHRVCDDAAAKIIDGDPRYRARRHR